MFICLVMELSSFAQSFFYQLYSIHAYKNGQYIPCVFFLLPSKTKQWYEHMFRHLTEACTNFDVTLNITYLHLDFEIAVHEVAVARWPNVIIKACQFHLSQAWLRKIQNLGLSTEYKKDDSEIAAWLKCFFGLSFLEPAEVEESFAYDFLQTCRKMKKLWLLLIT